MKAQRNAIALLVLIVAVALGSAAADPSSEPTLSVPTGGTANNRLRGGKAGHHHHGHEAKRSRHYGNGFNNLLAETKRHEGELCRLSQWLKSLTE
mmetsp:Transcript_2943/g.5235  ORF Transcript_2943/g.5235 Transcript_2943/m.5235 type:complete len:95 (+) Transcript_2943:363-647(+)